MALINCKECNAQVSDKAKTCPKCGASVVITETVKCFECKTELEKGTKVCSNCGAEQEAKQENKEEPSKLQGTSVRVFNKQPMGKSKKIMWALISGVALILVLIAIIIALAIKNQNKRQVSPPSGRENSQSNTGNRYSAPEPPREKTIEELREMVLDKERQNPLKYLSAEIKLKVKTPLFGKYEWESNVTISNSATMATFKDIVYEVQFLTKTNALLGKSPDTLFDYVPPKGSRSKRILIVLPKGTTNYAVKIISCK